MKKYLIIIGFAIILGVSFSGILFMNIEPELQALIKDENKVYAFQVGVFSNYDYALEESKKYNSALIVEDDKYYRVYIAIAKEPEIINLYEVHFSANNINYYLKEIAINDSFNENLSKYETLILSSDININDEITSNILKSYNEEKI